MKYLLLLYDDAEAVATLSADQRRSMVEDHIAYAGMLRERGAYVYGDPVDDPRTARTMRFSGDGEPIVTDGPFLEAKEHVGGFYLVDVENKERALELAAQIPDAAIPGLGIEVRQVMFFDGSLEP